MSVLLVGCKKSEQTTPQQIKGTVTVDGVSYGTVVIGAQTWTSENYYGAGGVTSPTSTTGTGKFYTLAEIQAITLPVGWRIPTQDDYVALLKSQGTVTVTFDGHAILDTIGARHLRALINWGIPGDNKSGFGALPVGDYNAYMNTFGDLNAYTTFWTSTPGTNTVDKPSQCIVVLSGYRTSYGTRRMPIEGAYVDPTAGVLNRGYSLRFVKDN
ncbi:FISUMP domain-containing protein [Mucilaginibacter flavus]|uniref:FISUMP domain-containing protein n=1 Tax=Mucilaginibacter flavus TaxID=931504 RepID=UPI0025B578BB|nr:FISUMP domain-containing protein [Mucilaginibacter flavus]MDN3581756.1 FISUMP domain-containing protein [Mucilaginibacter flavus]